MTIQNRCELWGGGGGGGASDNTTAKQDITTTPTYRHNPCLMTKPYKNADLTKTLQQSRSNKTITVLLRIVHLMHFIIMIIIAVISIHNCFTRLVSMHMYCHFYFFIFLKPWLIEFSSVVLFHAFWPIFPMKKPRQLRPTPIQNKQKTTTHTHTQNTTDLKRGWVLAF